MEVASQLYLAEILVAAGAFELARVRADDALRGARNHAPEMLGHALAVRAQSALRDGDLAIAEVCSSEAQAAADASGPSTYGYDLIHVARVETLIARGDLVGAQILARRARASVDARTERLTDPRHRETFRTAGARGRLAELSNAL
jgi:hypothetical protein